MSDTKTDTTAPVTKTEKKSNHVGGFWLKEGVSNGKKYSFLSGNIEEAGKKTYYTISKSKIPKEERGNRPDYLVYIDDYKPKGAKQTPPEPEKTEEEPF